METRKIIILSAVSLLVIGGAVVAFIMLRNKSVANAPSMPGNTAADANTPGASPSAPASRYPSREQMVSIAIKNNWDPKEPAAIAASYDQNEGTWRRGDWRFAIINTNPVTARAFKGANESFTYTNNFFNGDNRFMYFTDSYFSGDTLFL